MPWNQSDIRDFLRAWDRFADELEREIRVVAERYGGLMLQLARELVPVDTGALRDSIRVVHRHVAEQIILDVVSGGTAKVSYQWFVELGTQHSLPQPFMSPAYEAYVQPFEREVIATVKRIAKRA